MEKKQNNILYRVLWAYRDWLISTQAKCDCEWSRCLKKIFNDHNKREIRTLRDFLYIQSHLPIEDRNPFDPDLQFLVGVAYLCGWLPCENAVKEAHQWFLRSADQGSPKGMMAVGYLHEKRLGEYHDENTMLSYYSMAGSMGYAPAQCRLTSYHQQQLKQIYQNAEKARDASEKAQKAAENAQDIGVRTESVVNRNNEMLRRVEVSVQMLQSSLNGMWAEVQDAEEEFRKMLQQLQQETQKNLNKISKTELAEAEEFMSVLFKGDWRNSSRLCDASCDALVTAHVLMKVAEKLGITNYSGIVITAVWALEHECRRRFYDAFDRYLQTMGVQAEDRLSRMNLINQFFTLGSVGYIANSQDFNAFCRSSNLLSPAAELERSKRRFSEAEMIYKYWLPGTRDRNEKTFKSIIVSLNEKYRKPAAHAEEVGKKEAEECCDLLGITEAYRKMNNIAGALKALLWLTAPLE